jgi:hypothetical protein
MTLSKPTRAAAALLFFFLLAPGARADDQPFETGSYWPGGDPPGAVAGKIVSYNIRWRGGESLEKLIADLKERPELKGALIYGLQEVDRDKERTGHVNTARVLAQALGLNYAWAL